jgi:hypothetical protein
MTSSDSNFKHLVSLALPKGARPKVLTRILRQALTEKCRIAIISHKRSRRHQKLQVAEHNKTWVYGITDFFHLVAASEIILAHPKWDSGCFRVIYGDHALLESLAEAPELIHGSVPEIMDAVSAEIYGYMFPLDDELVVHGGEWMQTVLTNSRPPRA